MQRPIRLLTIAGSDSGGGAGIQADLKTFAALGAYGMSVVTAVTAQNTVEVRRVQAIDPEVVAAQIDAVLSDLGVDAIKIGMLGGAATVAAVAAALAAFAPCPLVLDPVMVAKSGDRLLDEDAVAALVAQLLPRATLVTPNLPELERLTGLPVANEPERRRAASALVAGGGSVLVKGGHGAEDPVVDLLFDGVRWHRFAWPRISTRNTHGTGCTLSSAIACFLARGDALPRAVAQAGEYLQGALRHAPGLGRGHGPLAHFWQTSHR